MYKNVLIPIPSDGLKKSDIKKIVSAIGVDVRKLTLAFVSDPLPPYIYVEYGYSSVVSENEHRKACKSFADKLFSKVGKKLPGINYETCHVFNDNVVKGIIDAAQKSKVDLIAMFSHKRKGLAKLFLGSDTQGVILSTKLPVLVV